MKAALQRAWYRRGGLSLALLPAAWVFGFMVRVRRFLYRRGWIAATRVGVPVIVVGNITVGGAGKTPLVIELARRFMASGRRVGVVSRGYGGQGSTTGDAPRLVEADTTAEQCGDEPLLIRRRAGCPVAVCKDRPAAARLLVAQGCDLLLADDGLQHYALARDMEIVVVDGQRRFGNARLLPAGPLREPLSRLEQVDFVCYNGTPGVTGQSSMPTYTLRLGDPLRLDGTTRRELASFGSTPVHAVAGIGAPSRFFDALRSAGVDVVPHPFPDHHRFVPGDLDFGDDLPVLMTEKDAVKCEPFATPKMYAVPVTAELPESFWLRLKARLEQLNDG